MWTFRGTGTAWRGTSVPDKNGTQSGTQWITILYMPIIPLGRYYFRRGESYQEKSLPRNTVTPYKILARTKLDWGEVLTTYLIYWFILPVLVLAPFVLISVLKIKLPNSASLIWLFGAVIWVILALATTQILATLLIPNTSKPKPKETSPQEKPSAN